ncbi:putative pre-16S rRNA nuclease [Bacteroidota bacterium]|jgi:putative Holliday junction resolvase|nr:putative pre-16S rRNA nuclease [Bacteroidota bacterium]
MGRIIALDYGKKRTGIAATDPLKIIANGLLTIETEKLFDFLKDYAGKESVEKIIIGNPTNLDGSPTDATASVQHCIRRLKNMFPAIPVIPVDERYSSKMASRAMVEMGMKKKDRREKSNIDVIAATMMLQDYLANNIL